MTEFLRAIDGSGPREAAPIAADRLVEGAPHTTTALDYQRGDKLFAGEWSATVGAWRVSYDEWEFCHVLEGVCELVGDDAIARRFKAGDSFVIEPGFVGVWRVIEPMKKRFVVRYD
jgi:uncharacterized cupin superfamily protein